MGLIGLGLLILVVVAALGAFRYGPLVDDVRTVRASARRVADQAQSLDAATLDRAAVERLRGGMRDLGDGLAPLERALSDDPLIEVARAVPLLGAQVRGVDALVDAADSLAEAGDLSLDLADRVVSLREESDADPATPLMAGLVELMATSTDQVDHIGQLIDTARARLDEVPGDALGEILEARDLVADPLDTYKPLFDAYRDADDVLPGVLGWGGQRRYLVLAQNPAELRPTGGYSGTVGVVTFRDGVLVNQRFQDVAELDRLEGLPYVQPPDALVDYLLGEDQSWRLADANWSPDFPTSAQQALEFYELQAGDGDIDGVIGITTFALDRLLEVVGPVTVEDFGVTVAPGDVTSVLLDATRGGPRQGRKEVLDVLAREVMRRVLRLPPRSWVPMLEALTEMGATGDARVWFRDADAQALAVEAGWAGGIRQDPGDYVYVVESNVAPTSKYNLVVDRASSLVVKLDEEGDALTSLRLDWRNDAAERGEPYRSLREYSVNQDGWYGAYVRLLVPAQAELLSVSGRASDELRGAESVAEEADRAVFGNYLLMEPGDSTLTYLWTAPGVAVEQDGEWEYRLTLQKQPGAREESVRVRVDLPGGATVTEASEAAVVEGDRVRYETSTVADEELFVRYRLAGS